MPYFTQMLYYSCYYVNNPKLFWDYMLKITSRELQLITNTDMYNFFKKEERLGHYGIMN